VSRYFYVNGDPINLIDPTGHDSVSGAGWDAGYYAALQQSGQQLTPSEQVAQQHAQAISDWEDAQRGEANIRSNRHLYCRPPAAWDHRRVSSASSMGPPLRQ
jgi:hypothetical protein